MKIPPINIQTNKIPVKPQWKLFQENDTRQFFEPFKVSHKQLGNLDVSIRKYIYGYCNWIIEVKNALNKVLGKEILFVEKNPQKIIGLDIRVENEYRRTARRPGYKIGELLRLASIMEMMENKVSHIKIYSKGSAVYFHSKYGFETAIVAFADRNRALEAVMRNCDRHTSDYADKAENILTNVMCYQDDAELQRAACKETNALLKEYIQKVLKIGKPEETYPFDMGMDMMLTKRTVEKNREFYNRLFENTGIDYKV